MQERNMEGTGNPIQSLALSQKASSVNVMQSNQDPYYKNFEGSAPIRRINSIGVNNELKIGWSWSFSSRSQGHAEQKHPHVEAELTNRTNQLKKGSLMNFKDYDLYDDMSLDEQVRHVNEAFNRLKSTDVALSVLASFNVAFAFGLQEWISRKGTEQLKSFESRQFLLELLVLQSTVLLSVAICFRYKVEMEWKQKRGRVTKKDNLCNSGSWKMMLVELVLCALSPYPGLSSEKYDFGDGFMYSINDILCATTAIKVYIILRAALIFSSYMNPRCQRICSINGIEINYFFAWKSLMRTKPFTVLSFMFILLGFFFSYLLRLFENASSDSSSPYYYTNAIWCMIVTMTTVGYGDFYPTTHLGRFVGIIICLWGSFFVSLFVVTLTNLLLFEANEEKAFKLLARLQYKEQLKKDAVLALGHSYRTRVLRQKFPDKKELIVDAVRKFKKYIFRFKQTTRAIRTIEEGNNEIDSLQREIDELKENVKKVESKQDDIVIMLQQTQFMLQGFIEKYQK